MNNAFFKFLLGFVILGAILKWGSDDAFWLRHAEKTEVSQTN